MKVMKKMMWFLPLLILAISSCVAQKGTMEEQTGGTDTPGLEEYTEFAAKGLTMKGGGAPIEAIRPTVTARPLTAYPHSFFSYMPVLYGGAFSDETMGMAVDSEGRVHVVGRSYKDADRFSALWLIFHDGQIERQPMPDFMRPEYNYDLVDIKIGEDGSIYILGNKYSGSSPTKVVVVKYDASKTVLWHHESEYGAYSFNKAADMALDERNGRLFIVGATQGPNNEYSASRFLTNRFNTDAVIAMFDTASGERRWVKTAGSERAIDVDGETKMKRDRDEFTGVAVNAAGDVYISGFTFAKLDSVAVSPVPGCFVAKYSHDNLESGTGDIFFRQFAVHPSDVAKGVALDASGNAYVVGTTEGNMSGGGRLGESDIFAAKFDTNLNRIWIEQLGGAGTDGGNVLTVDNGGNVYAAGIIDKGAGLSGSFVLYKIDASGNLIWTMRNDCKSGKCDGTPADAMSTATAVTLDIKNDVYVAGNEWGDFMCKESAGASDIFVLRVNNSGN